MFDFIRGCVLLLAIAAAAYAQLPAASGQQPLHSPAPPDMASGSVSGDPAKDLEPLLKKFVDVLSAVQREGAEVEPVDKLVYQGAIPSMLRSLDPHTQFFDPAQFEQLRQMEESEQKGFGSIVSVLPGQVIFLQTLPGTPSNKAGIQPGDELLAINNVVIRTLEPQQIIELLTEARQQNVAIYIHRQGLEHPLQLALTPALVDSPSVDRAFFLEPRIGYVRIASWDMQTAKQLQEALQKLGGNSLTGLVLDLRNNPGGLVKAALDAAAMFLPPGQRILTARGRTREVEAADVPKDAKPYHFKMAVLINERTASASEILSGALQDHDRAVIVGTPSYGKGLVQSVLPLSDGAGLAITTAFYYTPSGRSIQRPLVDSALSETFNNKPDKQRPVFKTDDGRTVLGGGGIEPDIRVYPPALSRLEAVLDGSGAMTAFATDYLNRHGSGSVPEPFDVTPEMLDELKVYLAGRQIQPTIAEWSADQQWIRSRLKEEIVTQAHGVAAGDEIHAHNDPQVQAAVRALGQPSLLAAR